MTIRALTRPRAFVFVLLFLAGLLQAVAFFPAPAFAANPYQYTDGNEGDPGDGVLDPAADGGGGNSGDAHGPEITASSSVSTSWIVWDIVPIIVPNGGTGRVVVLMLPRAWWHPVPGLPHHTGRWHDAP